MKESWGSYFRSDKLLLLYLLLVMLGITIVIAMHHHDPENISWAREECGTIIGALLMLITGASKGHNEPPPGTVKQITTQTTVQQAEDPEAIKPVEPKP